MHCTGEWSGVRSVLINLFIDDNHRWRLCVSFLTVINAHNLTPLCLSSVLHLFEFPCTPCSSSLCSRAAGLWASNSTVSEPLSSLGFHEARQGCVRPRRHPGSLLCWWPLGVATSRRTSATSSQLLWRVACSQHPIKHSSQTNLRYRVAHCSGAGGGF